jgi:hypothetical protein
LKEVISTSKAKTFFRAKNIDGRRPIIVVNIIDLEPIGQKTTKKSQMASNQLKKLKNQLTRPKTAEMGAEMKAEIETKTKIGVKIEIGIVSKYNSHIQSRANSMQDEL